jgi:hypothetical protein
MADRFQLRGKVIPAENTSVTNDMCVPPIAYEPDSLGGAKDSCHACGMCERIIRPMSFELAERSKGSPQSRRPMPLAASGTGSIALKCPGSAAWIDRLIRSQISVTRLRRRCSAFSRGEIFTRFRAEAPAGVKLGRL